MFRNKAEKGAHIAQIKTPRLVGKLDFEKNFKVIKEVKL